MKTYSVAFKEKEGYWITNWGKHFDLEDVNWQEVEEFCKQRGLPAYGYYYGHKSNELTSARCRTVLKVLNSSELEECGCCGCWHRKDYYGDCRNDEERYVDLDNFLTAAEYNRRENAKIH